MIAATQEIYILLYGLKARALTFSLQMPVRLIINYCIDCTASKKKKKMSQCTNGVALTCYRILAVRKFASNQKCF